MVKIDSFFQELPTVPALHVIIEAHPDVLEHMRSQGWYSKPNVKILEGKWQDYVDSPELLGVGGFDVIYTDTFSEEYQGSVIHSRNHNQRRLNTVILELHQFFKRLPDLVDGPESRFSFFNGLGATSGYRWRCRFSPLTDLYQTLFSTTFTRTFQSCTSMLLGWI